MKVLLVDDHTLFRELLREHLTKKGFLHIEDAGDGTKAIERAREFKPDIILMDIDLPSLNGIETTKAVKKELPEAKVIIVTASNDRYTFESLKPYINGFLKKIVSLSNIEEAIKRVFEGEDYFYGLEELEVRNECAFEEEYRQILTNTEQKIVSLILEESLHNKEIAKRLYMAERTVKQHLTNIYKKLNVTNKIEMINMLKN